MRQLLTTLALTPSALASFPTPSASCIAISKMFMNQYYHSSDNAVNTKVTVKNDLLELMNESQGKRLRRVRKSKNWSQQKLANEAGCSVSLIGMIETDQRGYGESIVSISRNLEVSPEYLQMITDEIAQTSPVPGYSVEALALAWLLDQIKNKLHKKMAEVEASAAILRYVNMPDAKPTHTQGGR